MLGVLAGFAVIGSVLLVGYLGGRLGLGGQDVVHALNRVAFFIATPALIFSVLARADLTIVLSGFMLLAIACAIACAMLFIVARQLAFRVPLAETTIGVASAIYVNSNNIGLPIAVYVLGDASLIAPLLLMQPLLLGPVILTVLDLAVEGRPSFRSIITQPLRNPIILAAFSGLVVAIFGWEVPGVIAAPIDLIGGAAIPIVLLAFGMSLHGQRPLRAGTGRRQVLAATAIKSVGMPVIAYLLARFALGLPPEQVFAAVIIAALPTGQVVYNYAARYGRGVIVARDVALLSTFAAIPVMLLAAALLA